MPVDVILSCSVELLHQRLSCCLYAQYSRLSWCEWMLSKGWSFPNYWVGQKVRLVFFCMMAPGVLSCLLTSFKTILLDCTVTAVISACIKENLPKLVNFCATILIFKMEESMQYLWHIMFYYFKKGKNSTNANKDVCSVWRRCCVQCMEKVLWLIEHVKGGLRNFLVLSTLWPNNSLPWGCPMH